MHLSNSFIYRGKLSLDMCLPSPLVSLVLRCPIGTPSLYVLKFSKQIFHLPRELLLKFSCREHILLVCGKDLLSILKRGADLTINAFLLARSLDYLEAFSLNRC